MTSKELLYVEDALGHEKFMKTCCDKTAVQLKDTELKGYIAELANTHKCLFDKFLNLL